MAMLMRLCGIVLAAIGLALGVMSISSPGQMQIYGLTPETAAILLVGGILSLGLGALLDSNAGTTASRATDDAIANRLAAAQREPAKDYSFGKTTAIATGAAIATVGAAEAASKGAAETISETLSGAKSSVSETIEALEQAKSDIKAALGGSESFDPPAEEPTPVPEPPKLDIPAPPAAAEVLEPVKPAVEPAAETEKPDEPAEDVEEAAPPESGLFVVEEQVVRGKPARLLSDGTVEAETEEGWMRFENLEHLNEYLDSSAAT